MDTDFDSGQVFISVSFYIQCKIRAHHQRQPTSPVSQTFSDAYTITIQSTGDWSLVMTDVTVQTSQSLVKQNTL